MGTLHRFLILVTSHRILTQLLHHFVRELLFLSCPDEDITNDLWARLLPELLQSYRKAAGHVDFLLSVERKSKLFTFWNVSVGKVESRFCDKVLREIKYAQGREKAECGSGPATSTNA